MSYVSETPQGVKDAHTLRALAHPLRLQILGSLRVDGPATSAMLARRLGTDTGQTSFHLRQLAKYGFIVDAPDLNRGRERWWRARSSSTTWDAAALSADRSTASALDAFERSVLSVWTSMVEAFLTERSTWSPAWQRAAGSGDYPIRTTPEGLVALHEELIDVIHRHARDEANAADAENAVVILQLFPRRPQA